MMLKKTKVALDSIFAQHAETQRRAAEVQMAKESAADSFLREFLAARSATVEPAMKEIGEYIREKGYKYVITAKEDGEGRADGNRDIPASIAITIYPKEAGNSPLGWPHLTVICKKREQKVAFHESTMTPTGGGHTSGAGEVTLSELTAELVQDKILKVVAAIFR